MGTLLMQNELGTLETGLKDLQRSRLMCVQEFKDMYGAIEEHHRDLKLAHLTGKARDLLEKAARDTKFFHVLVKMLSEVKQLRTAKQRESLQKVHSWYMANRHTLSSRPRFGKAFQLKEAEDFKQKIMSAPRSARGRQSARENKAKTVSTRLASADGMHQFFRNETPVSRTEDTPTRGAPVIHDLPSNKDYVSQYLSSTFYNGSTDFQQHVVTDMPPAGTKLFVNQLPLNAIDNIHVLSPSLLDRSETELQRLVSTTDQADEVTTQRLQSVCEVEDASNISHQYIESLISESHRGDRDSFDNEAINTDGEDMELREPRRKLSRAQTPSASIRPTITDQSSNVSNAAFMPKKMIHPIASLVNPHAQLAAQEAEEAEQEFVKTRENLASSMRVLSGRKSRQKQQQQSESQVQQQKDNIPIFRPTTGNQKIDNWKSFTRDWTYGQDILRDITSPSSRANDQGKLNFVGRSGTAVDVRYTAHEQGETPESETPQVLAFYTSQNPDTKEPEVLGPLPVPLEPPQKSITDQPLEEFYQFTDGHYPAKLPKYRPYSSPQKISSARSEVSKDKKAEPNKPQKVQPLGKHLLDNKENEEKKAEEKELEIVGRGREVKLDQVVGMIDDVTEDMTHYKEKLAPTPQAGFRQPSSVGVPMRPLSRPSTATGIRTTSPVYPHVIQSAPPTLRAAVRSTSPVQRSNTPTQPPITPDVAVSRPFFLTSNPFTSRDILIPSHDAPEKFTSRVSLPNPTNSVVQAIDWRGKITPESMRYKWQATRFGGHTYVKKLSKSKRPVGATHAGKRPRTAPVTARERWNTEKPSDQNTRITSQAATNSMMQVDQQAVDSMMVVQHILGSSDSRMGSYSDLFMDEDFLKSFNMKHSSAGTTMTNTPVPMEYLSIVSNAPRSAFDSRTQSRHSRLSERPESQDYQLYEEEREGDTTDTCTPRPDHEDEEPRHHVKLHLPTPAHESLGSNISDSLRVVEDVTTQTDDLEEELRQAFEESDDQDLRLTLDRPIGVISEEASDVDSRGSTPARSSVQRPVERHTEDLHDGEVHIEVTSIPPGGRAPTPPQQRDVPLQELSKSKEWHFSPDVETDRDLTERMKVNPFYQVKDSNSQWIKLHIKPETYCFECIPDNMSAKVGRSAGRMPGRTQSASSQVLRMARKQNEYFKRAPPVRTPPSIPSPYHVQRVLKESPRYGNTYNSGLEHHARSVRSPKHFMEHVSDLRKDIRSAPAGGQYSSGDNLRASLQVSRLDMQSRENTMDMSDGLTSILRDHTMSEVMMEGREATPLGEQEGTEEAAKHVGFIMENEKSSVSKSTSPRLLSSRERTPTSLAHIGRPIPQYAHIGDPDEVAAAAQIQKEASAAVDIQRIFRGYVARNKYKILLKEERERLEDDKMAENASNKKHKEHLNAKTEIYNRPSRSVEDKQWSNKVKKIQDNNADIRQKKREDLADKNAKNYHEASTKLAVIGPHVNIYEIYHPKQVGPTKHELSVCATHIQRHIRGFLVRQRFEKLRRKAKWYGTTWQKMVRDYKGTLARCQRRHGMDRVSTPFTFKDMSEYMDLRRRYESVFEKKAYGGELDVTDMEQFFRECDLYPSKAEIEEGIDVVLQGQTNKKRGLKKSEMLELVFYIYVPKATGLKNTRQSTWMNPIIDGVEARRLLGLSSLSKKEFSKIAGSEFIEPAPLDVCAKLVIDSKRARRQKEQQEKQKEEEAKINAIKESVREKRHMSRLQDDMSDTSSTTTMD